MSRRKTNSALWYWLLLIFPSVGALIVMQREYAVGSMLAILPLVLMDIGTRKNLRWHEPVGYYLAVAAIAGVVYKFISIRWMYPELFDPDFPEPTDRLFLDADLVAMDSICLLYTSPSPRDKRQSRMPSSA